MTKEEISRLCDDYDEVLLADGFEDAFLGIARKFNHHSALYDLAKCVQILMDRDGLSEDDAVEFLEFNVLGAWVGGSYSGVFGAEGKGGGSSGFARSEGSCGHDQCYGWSCRHR